MITYLASYPRSGNALLRVILWQCFGLTAVAVREAPASDRARQEARRMRPYLGPADPDGVAPADLPVLACAAGGPFLIKTHDRPLDDSPAVLVVRDGRAAVRSLARFRTEVAGVPTTVDQIIGHRHWNWSAHVMAWLEHPAPKLVLRYEDLGQPDDATLARIGDFLGVDRTGDFTATVAALRKARPGYVNEASNAAGVAEVERDHGALFWSLHGAAMDRLGYRR